MNISTQITNNSGNKLSAIITAPDKINLHPFVIIFHGFLGYKEERNHATLSESLFKKGIGSIRFDASGFGESEGNIEDDYRFSNYVNDIEDIYQYLLSLPFVDKKKIGVCGQSMGGSQAVIFASNHPELNSCCVISAPNQMGTGDALDKYLIKWKKEGYLNLKSSKYGKVTIPYSFIIDANKYRMSDIVGKINCPQFYVAGTDDVTVFPKETREIFNHAKTKKDFVLIEGMNHYYKKDQDILKIITKKVTDFFVNNLQ